MRVSSYLVYQSVTGSNRGVRRTSDGSWMHMPRPEVTANADCPPLPHTHTHCHTTHTPDKDEFNYPTARNNQNESDHIMDQ